MANVPVRFARQSTVTKGSMFKLSLAAAAVILPDPVTVTVFPVAVADKPEIALICVANPLASVANAGVARKDNSKKVIAVIHKLFEKAILFI